MADLFVVDWSFILIVVLLALMTGGLGLRHILLRRRQKREERRASRRAIREWLRNSNMQPLDMPEPGEPKD